MFATPKAFIFDCDGTLIDSMGAWIKASSRLLSEYGVEATPEDLAQFEHLAIEDECAAYHEHWGVGANAAEVVNRLLEIIRESYVTCVPTREGVRSFLDAVRDVGIPMAIATSTDKDSVEIALKAHGLLEYFSNITTTKDSGTSKRRPDVYNLALARLAEQHGLGEVVHEDVWVFEDAFFGLKSTGEVGYRRVGIFDPNGHQDEAKVRANCEIFIEDYRAGLLDEILNFEA
ncbi:HAD family hydrolase [Collinsella provencensis]|uniref:HAD family hydrolase n=1 Tax=Collinsella provencensis TaxID=1937461 RepID=UPI000C82E769|nr:HAD family phosphatase [Collinsella provencensis]